VSTNVWDDRYDRQDYAYGTEPNAFLVSQRWRLERGMRVLAVADGEGRNGVWLAQQGMRVTSVDGSAVGLQKALKLALARGVALQTTCADLLSWDWPVAAYGAVAAVFIHFPPEDRAAMHRAMLGAVKPGGVILMEAFRPAQLGRTSGGPPVRAMLYDAATLRGDFADADILELEEVETELDEGPLHRGPAATVRLVARRPLT
jgi:SAM-dependent methyltransferase